MPATDTAPNTPSNSPLSFIRLPEVMRITGLSRATIYNKMAAGEFPVAVELGPRSRGWVRHEVEGWVLSRITASRTPVMQKPTPSLPRTRGRFARAHGADAEVVASP
jgi:prophage regulatory protein